ncbi:MAG TPA: choice-of-anchor B family protein [Pyrinomonadaceae bacterium]|jgi:choice-of-anchor B domain-containing protein|nr:choice-of-anchor B family protein [Pyrinomonadaceae bacterium]
MRFRKLFAPLLVLFALGFAAWSSLAHDGEHHSPGGNGQPGDAPLAAQGASPCVGGMAGTFPCHNVDLGAFLPVADIDGTTATNVTANDIWGWTDPQTDKEYALLGLSNGVAFVDVTNPSSPVYLGNLPRHSVDSLWRSVKVYRNHLFVVSEAVDHGMQVFDLTRLRGVTTPQTFTETAHYNNFGRAHTIAVNEETGYAYAAGSRPGAGRVIGVDTCGLGLHVVDVRNPSAPAFAGCVDQDGYVHETECVIYRGPDAQYREHEICFNANEDTLTIVDVSNKSAPAQLSRTTYAGVGYTHQGWLTGDHARFLLNDELDEQHLKLAKNRTFVWDVSDLDAPFVQTVFQGSTQSIDHNLYVRGLFTVQSNYRSGVRLLDTRNATPVEVGFFDVYPVDDQALFNGTWANYPFFASGTVIASGIEQGLFVLRPQVGLPVYLDYEPFFVRQHYRDFFSREPDEPGQGFWTGVIESCMGNDQCREVRRVNVSGAFFLSIEFQQTGYLIERMYKASYGDATGTSTLGGTPHTLTVPVVRFEEFLPDTQRIGQGVAVLQPGWEAQLDANKTAFAQEFVQRPRFTAAFPSSMTPAEFVDQLNARAGNPLDANERQALVGELTNNNTTSGRASVLRKVAEDPTLEAAEKNRAFVLIEYFGYLRRDPNEGQDTDYTGYDFWLGNLEKAGGNFVQAELVKAFITSDEYRNRFRR